MAVPSVQDNVQGEISIHRADPGRTGLAYSSSSLSLAILRIGWDGDGNNTTGIKGEYYILAVNPAVR